jgi:hypothetical protein
MTHDEVQHVQHEAVQRQTVNVARQNATRQDNISVNKTIISGLERNWTHMEGGKEGKGGNEERAEDMVKFVKVQDMFKQMTERCSESATSPHWYGRTEEEDTEEKDHTERSQTDYRRGDS